MNIGTLAFALLTAHALADFPLQTDNMAANKFDDAIVRGLHAWVHMLAVAVVLVPIWPGHAAVGMAALSVFVGHFLIDTRRWAEPKDGFKAYPIAVDQSLHLAWIFAVAVNVAPLA